jgi:hypothetical protein
MLHNFTYLSVLFVFNVFIFKAAIVGLFHTLIMCGLLYYWNHAVFQKSSKRFQASMLIGCMMMNGSVFCWPYVNALSCMLGPSLLAVGMCLTMSSIFVKTWRIYRIFDVNKNKLQVTNLTDSDLAVRAAAVVLLQVVIVIAWYLHSAPTPAVDHMSTDPLLTYATCAMHETAYPYTLFALNGALIFYGIFLAGRVRKVKSDFNESKHIAVVIYNVVFCSSMVIFFMIFTENPTAVLLILCIFISFVSIAASSVLLVGKMYQIWSGNYERKLSIRASMTQSGGGRASQVYRGSTALDSHLGSTNGTDADDDAIVIKALQAEVKKLREALREANAREANARSATIAAPGAVAIDLGGASDEQLELTKLKAVSTGESTSMKWGPVADWRPAFSANASSAPITKK